MNVPNPNPKRNHHVLPRFYLKGFVRSGQEIWVYQKDLPWSESKFHPNPRLDRIVRRNAEKRGDAVGAQRDFYAFKKAGGEMDFESFENFLASIEGQANPVIDKMRNAEFPNLAERGSVALYLAHLHKRLPNFRGAVGDLLPETMEKLIADPQTYIDLEARGFKATPEMIRQVAEGRIFHPDYIKATHLNILKGIFSSQIMDALTAMKWRLYIAPRDTAFISCDNPMFYFKDLGLTNRRSEISFPLSSQVCLVLSHHPVRHDRVIQANPFEVREINRRSASRAVAQVYSHSKEAWTLDLLNKASHTLRSLFKE